MWGIIPAAGVGSRIQPLAFSKELLPVGSRFDGDTERPRAVSEYLVERLIAGGATKLCFVIAPGKSDILEYYGGRIGGADICYVVQPKPAGLCDSLFRAAPFVRPDEPVLIGLPDTVWFPADGLARLPDDELSFLCFPVERPEFFDAVVMDEQGRVEEIQVKRPGAASPWIWGAFKMPGHVFHTLHALWQEPGRGEEYFGTLVNAWLARGGSAKAVRAGEAYVDVGTLHGYREAISLLGSRAGHGPMGSTADATPGAAGPHPSPLPAYRERESREHEHPGAADSGTHKATEHPPARAGRKENAPS
jgi:dTDP-glucose pyrophosphorylase